MPTGIYKRTKEHIEKSVKNFEITTWKGGMFHHQWKGTNASYSAVHHWVRRNFKKTSICGHCLTQKRTCWANKTGKYLRIRKDWLELCYKCHKKMDNENPVLHRFQRQTLRRFRKKLIGQGA